MYVAQDSVVEVVECTLSQSGYLKSNSLSPVLRLYFSSTFPSSLSRLSTYYRFNHSNQRALTQNCCPSDGSDMDIFSSFVSLYESSYLSPPSLFLCLIPFFSLFLFLTFNLFISDFFPFSIIIEGSLLGI